MATTTETVELPSDHISTTLDEQFVNPEKDDAIAEKISSLANEDGDKHDNKPEDGQSQVTPSPKTEGDEVKAELAAAAEIEKSDDSSALNVSVEDSLKADTVDDAPYLAVDEGDKEKAEPAVAVEKTDDSVRSEPVVDNLKEEKDLIPESQIISVAEPVHLAISQQDETPSTEPAAEEPELVHEKSSDATETNQPEVEEVKQAEILETSAEKEEKPEPVAIKEREVTEEPAKESQEKSEETEQPNTIELIEPSAEANEEKTTVEIPEETNNIEVEPTKKGQAESEIAEVEPAETGKEKPVVTEIEPTETGKEEHVVTEVDEKQKEPEEHSTEEREEKKPNTSVILEQITETNDTIAEEEKTRELESEAPLLKETDKDEAVPTETEKAEPVVAELDENQSELGIQSLKQEQSGDTVEVQPLKESDIEVVKETNNSESEAIPVKEDRTDTLSNGVEEKPSEQLQAGEEVVETSKEVEPEQATEKSEGSLDVAIKNSTDKVEESETKTVVNASQVSLNEESQTNPANSVEPSREVEGKIVVEDGKKEPVNVTENPTTGVEENVAEDEKKEPEIPDAVQVSSREADVVDIKKADEQNEAETATPEAGDADTKVDEISKAVTEPARKTLASKFEEKEEEETIQNGVDNSEKEQIEEQVKTEVEATKENDTTAISKDLPKETPAKPAQKQSNNIISKVKQSLVKAKKAITGKSPASKNPSSEPKEDLNVK